MDNVQWSGESPADVSQLRRIVVRICAWHMTGCRYSTVEPVFYDQRVLWPLVVCDQIYGTNVEFYFKINPYLTTTCHLQPKLLELKAERKAPVPLHMKAILRKNCWHIKYKGVTVLSLVEGQASYFVKMFLCPLSSNLGGCQYCIRCPSGILAYIFFIQSVKPFVGSCI